MKIAFNTQPLSSGHKTRGIGFYTKNLLAELKKMPELEIIEFGSLDEVKTVDLIHHPYFDLFTPTLKINSTPTVVTIHDVIPLIFSKHYPPGIRGKINLFRQKRALKKVAAIITDSKSSKADIHRYLQIDLNKIFVVPLAPANGDKGTANLAKFSLPEKFGLFMGSVNWNKNLLNLTEGGLASGLDIVLVGKDFESKADLNHPERASYKQFLAKYSDHPKVHLLGFVSDPELRALIKKAEVVLLPSWYEGFGLPILDTQANGTPVVTSQNSSMPEVGGDGAAYVDPADQQSITQAIKKILDDDKYRAALIKNGLANVKRFSWRKTAEQTVKVYEAVVAK